MPGFAVVVILTIAAGTGLCTAVFSVLHGIAYPSMPYHAPERLVVLGATMNRQVTVATEWATPEQVRLWREAPPRSFATTSAFASHFANIENAVGGTTRVDGAVVDGSFFPLLGVAPRLGRTFAPADVEAQGSS
jgi:hypothetical protein